VNHSSSSREEVELRAYQHWEARGRPSGTPETDWFNAEQELAAVEPEDVLSKLAREVGSVLGNAVAFVTDLEPSKPESPDERDA
jgi:Protein of unknown function (DUF2934)